MEFYKFNGAGNDFVVIDNRLGRLSLDAERIAAMCNRRFGIGADGLMTLESAQGTDYDFEMVYYNSDGRIGSMCGNGGRCIAAFAHMLGIGSRLHFRAYDGPHTAEIDMWDGHEGVVSLGMRSVPSEAVSRVLDGWYLDTGSPHYVQRVSGLENFDVVREGRRIRYMAELFPQGTNVDFVEKRPDGRLFVRTYERGVEDETYACGTGITAAAIVTGNHSLSARGGNFTVDFHATPNSYENIKLIGPVALSFKGVLY